MTADLIIFTPKAELDARGNLKNFIHLCRNDLTTFGRDLDFEADEWDISNYVHLKGMGEKRIRLRFYTQMSLELPKQEPMTDPFNSFAKAYARYSFAINPRKNLSTMMSGLRIIHDALIETGSGDPTAIDATILNRAAQLAIERYGRNTAYSIGNQIHAISDFVMRNRLAIIPTNSWKNPNKRPEGRNRVGAEFDERRSSKMPSEAALQALPRIFWLADEEVFVMVSSIAALLCAAPDRINEVLMLSTDCEVREPRPDGSEAYGLRWWTSKGAAPMIKWIVPSMKDAVIEAIAKIRMCTFHARDVARWYEQNSKKIFLPPEYEHLRKKELLRNPEVGFILFGKETDRSVINEWYKSKNIKTVCIDGKYYVRFSDVERIVLADLPRGFPVLNPESGMRFSEALFTVRKNALATDKANWVGVIRSVSINQVNNRLGPKSGSYHMTIFERYGFTEPDGSPIKVTTHQFRHYLNTLAQAGGLSQLDIAKWSGRKNIHQNAEYDHMTADELVLKIRNAIGDDRQMFGPLAELPKQIVIHRDEFARLKVPTAHTTEFGVCIHDYTMSPCQLHADCLNCNEQVCIKGDETRSSRIRTELASARENLAAARQADKDGYFGASRWVEHNRLTVERLEQLCAILDDPFVPLGAIIQLSGLLTPSRIEQATQTRAALGYEGGGAADTGSESDAIRGLLTAMESQNVH